MFLWQGLVTCAACKYLVYQTLLYCFQLCKPMALFFVNDSKELMPIAIQLFQDPGDANPVSTKLYINQLMLSLSFSALNWYAPYMLLPSCQSWSVRAIHGPS